MNSSPIRLIALDLDGTLLDDRKQISRRSLRALRAAADQGHLRALCNLGWCLEVVFCTVNSGQWVNRGFLNGPVCPIYGFGMVIVLLALEPLAHRPLALFVGSALLTSTLELALTTLAFWLSYTR